MPSGLPRLYGIATIGNITDMLSSIYAFQRGAVELNWWNAVFHLGNYPSLFLAVITYQILITLIYLLFPRAPARVVLVTYTVLKIVVAVHNVLLYPPPV